MDHTFCPGSKILRQPAPEFFNCPSCGEEVEIWTDELKRNCPSCHRPVYRDAGMSCLEWCKRGKECVGDSAYDNYMQNKAVTLKKDLLDKVRDRFPDDNTKVAHATSVLKNAERLLQSEQGEWHIVIPASILNEIGIDEDEGSPVVRKILLRLGLRMPDINEICDITNQHRSHLEATSDNFRIVNDADLLVNFRKSCNGKTDEQLRKMIDESFLTDTAKEMALRELVNHPAAQRATAG